MNEFPISNLRAKYADKLTEGSPDKKAIEDLKTAVQALEGKALKIYYVEDDTIGREDLADVEGLLDALATGKYQALHLKNDNGTYYVTYHVIEESNRVVQLIGIISTELISITYAIYNEEWGVSDDPTETFTFHLTPVEPGTKLYQHNIPQFYSGGGGYVISTRSERYTNLNDVIADFNHEGTNRILHAMYGIMGGTRNIIYITSSSQQGQPTTLVYYFNNDTIESTHITQSTINEYTVTPL